MKIDSNNIDKQRLTQAVHAAYGVNLMSITFLPKGEDAYAYKAQTDIGQDLFIRVQPTASAPNLPLLYPLLDILQQVGITQVLAPNTTLLNASAIEFDDYTVAVFPYIDGVTLYQQGVQEDDIRAAARLLARVHQAPIDTTVLRQEYFDNPFRDSILTALDRVVQSTPQTIHQHYVCRLLQAERVDIMTMLERMAHLQTRAQTLALNWVITHGDPNPDNFLKDTSGMLHLTDWGELAIGPPERDISSWAGAAFEVFLQQYVQIQPNLALHRDIFEFYFYRWSMQEIADYATRILFRQLGHVEDEHAWAELQDYLPIQHKGIADSLAQVQETMDRVLGAASANSKVIV